MTSERPLSFPELRFKYPTKPWGLPLFCHLLILGLFCVLYLPDQSQQFRGTIIFVCVVYLVAVSGMVWEWPARLFTKERGIRIKHDGIVVNGRFAPYDNIERIKHGSRFALAGSAILKLRKPEGRFFFNPFKGSPKQLVLRGYPFVYRDVIPVIREMHPDVPMSAVVQTNLANPENAGKPRSWLIFVVLILNVALLNWIRSPRHQGLFDYLIVGSILVSVSSYLANLCVALARDAREAFLQSVLQCVPVLGIAIQIQLWSPIEHFAFQTLVITAMALMFVAVLVFFGTKRLSQAAQVWIAVALLTTPVAAYYYGKSKSWPVKDITSLMPEPPKRGFVSPFWGQSGVHLAGSPSKDLSCVIHVPSLSRKPVPGREGENDVVWLGERFLVRRVRGKEHTSQLWVYDFSRREDVRVPAADSFRIASVRPVHHEGRLVAWIDLSDKTSVQTLRVWDLETGKDERPPYRLPGDVRWGAAVWLKDGTLALEGTSLWKKGGPEDPLLCVLRFTLGNAEPERFVSSQRYASWSVTWDFRHALALTKEGDDAYRVAFVDLETDEVVRLPGVGGYPHVVALSTCAFRLAVYGNRSMLCRFDFGTREEQLLHPVPDGTSICGISKTGRFALLASTGFPQRPGHLVLHVPTGRRHWVYPRGVFSSSSVDGWAARIPGRNPFSPDERSFVVQTMGAGTAWRTFFCTIPATWPGQ